MQRFVHMHCTMLFDTIALNLWAKLQYILRQLLYRQTRSKSKTTNSDYVSAPDASCKCRVAPISQRRQRARQLSTVFITSTLEERFKDRIRPTLILGFLHFHNPIDVDVIRKITFERLVCTELRFRSKAVLDSAYPSYFDEISLENIDMSYHVQRKEAAGWDENDIDAFMQELYAVDMDTDKPLWVMYVLNSLADGRSCLVFVIDHAIGDGISLTNVSNGKNVIDHHCGLFTECMDVRFASDHCWTKKTL